MSKNKIIKRTKEEQNIFDTFFILKGEKRFKDAFKLLYPLNKKYPDNYKVFFLLGSVLYQNGNLQNAEKYLKSAVLLNPKYNLSSLALIHTFSELNKWHSVFRET